MLANGLQPWLNEHEIDIGQLSLKHSSYTSFIQIVNQQDIYIRLEAYTEQSESNPGQSLGTITLRRETVWKTVPCHNDG